MRIFLRTPSAHKVVHMTTLGERIKLARGVEKQESFATALGISRGSLSLYERGETSPSADFLLKLCSERGVSPAWLLAGTGPMYDAERVTTEGARVGMLRAGDPIARVVVKPEPALDERNPALNHAGKAHVIECDDCEIMMLPMVEARLSAGTGSFETGANVERRYAFRTDFLLRKGQPAHMVLMRVTGDSMEPDIKHNDVVLIDQSQYVPRPGLLYAVGVEELVYLKAVNAEPGKLILSSYNTDYPPLEIDARGDLSNGIRIIGRAVWVGRELN